MRMATRVFLHVGTPKSGTTYLQSALWQNADQLAADGLLLPGRFKAHYAAAKGVTSRSSRKRQLKIDVAEAWPRLARQVGAWDGDAVISHELFAPATADQARDAMALLEGADVHIVLTVRALHRQLAASWQEQVKSGMATPFDAFLGQVENRSDRGEWFWEVQDVPAIAGRWGADLDPARVHVVTVPTEASDPGELWRRYTTALAVDGDAYDHVVPKKNVSLGPVETELLRRMHAVRDERFTDKGRHQWTRKLLAIEILGARRGTAIALPERARPWVEASAAAMIDAIDVQGYDVIGALDDLRWRPPSDDSREVASVTQDEVDEASRWAIARLQEQLVERRPRTPPPSVGPEEGVEGMLELLEHIRAADTETEPRPAPSRSSPTDRLRKSITAFRGR
jgi:hypothetical protein